MTLLARMLKELLEFKHEQHDSDRDKRAHNQTRQRDEISKESPLPVRIVRLEFACHFGRLVLALEERTRLLQEILFHIECAPAIRELCAFLFPQIIEKSAPNKIKQTENYEQVGIACLRRLNN